MLPLIEMDPFILDEADDPNDSLSELNVFSVNVTKFHEVESSLYHFPTYSGVISVGCSQERINRRHSTINKRDFSFYFLYNVLELL